MKPTIALLLTGLLFTAVSYAGNIIAARSEKMHA